MAQNALIRKNMEIHYPRSVEKKVANTIQKEKVAGNKTILNQDSNIKSNKNILSQNKLLTNKNQENQEVKPNPFQMKPQIQPKNFTTTLKQTTKLKKPKKKPKKPKNQGFKFGVSNLLKNITNKAVSNLKNEKSSNHKNSEHKKKKPKRKRKSEKLREKIIRKGSKVYLDYRFSIVDEDFEDEAERKWNIYNDPDNISIEELSDEESSGAEKSDQSQLKKSLVTQPVIKSKILKLLGCK